MKMELILLWLGFVENFYIATLHARDSTELKLYTQLRTGTDWREGKGEGGRGREGEGEGGEGRRERGVANIPYGQPVTGGTVSQREYL